MSKAAGPTATRNILADVLSNLERRANVTAQPASPAQSPVPLTLPVGGVYDYDLSEFPIFFFHTHRMAKQRRDPLVYSDSITGAHGQQVCRTWTVYPGPFGFGGASTQALLYDLIQLYFEQGAAASQIQFGTLRSLFLRRGDRHPSKHDYERMRRDMNILRGYDFHCVNAFYDRKRKAYGDLNWRLFGSVIYFKAMPDIDADQLPFGFIELSSVFRQIVRDRGFFALGFGHKFFHTLKPLEQRLALYLAKKFISQSFHRRFVEDLAKVIPIEATRPIDVRIAVQKAALGLIRRGFPLLERFSWEKARDGRWLANFVRKTAPKQDGVAFRRAAESLAPVLQMQIERIVEAVGSEADRLWWTQCVKRLGAGPIDRALGQLKEAKQIHRVRNPGGLLTKILKDIAGESGVILN